MFKAIVVSCTICIIQNSAVSLLVLFGWNDVEQMVGAVFVLHSNLGVARAASQWRVHFLTCWRHTRCATCGCVCCFACRLLAARLGIKY